MPDVPNTSLGKVVAVVMVVIALLGWCFAAAQYADSPQGRAALQAADATDRPEVDPDGRPIRRNFFRNAIEQLPHAAEVLSFTLKRRRLLATLIVLLELACAGFWIWTKRVERELAAASRGRFTDADIRRTQRPASKPGPPAGQPPTSFKPARKPGPGPT